MGLFKDTIKWVLGIQDPLEPLSPPPRSEATDYYSTTFITIPHEVPAVEKPKRKQREKNPEAKIKKKATFNKDGKLVVDRKSRKKNAPSK